MSNNYGFDSIEDIYPYNFVRIKGKCTRLNNKKGNLTGCIDVSITPKTNLIIPGEQDGNVFKLFEYDNKFIIPGSQMRGVVRNSYEALTNSCLSQIEDSDVSFRYSFFEGSKWEAKIFEYNYNDETWEMYPVKADKLYYPYIKKEKNDYKNSYELVKNFNRINFYIKGELLSSYSSYKNNLGNKSLDEKNRKIYTYDIKKKNISVYEAKSFSIPNNIKIENFAIINRSILRFGEKTTNGDFSIKLFKKAGCGEKINLEILERNCNKYIEILKDTIEKDPKKATADGKYNLYKDLVKAIEEKRSFVAYCNKESKLLSPAQIGREMLDEKLNSKYQGYESCTSDLCPACALFGTTSKDEFLKTKSLKSRIRFTDFSISKKDLTNNYDDNKNVVLVTLGSHLTNYKFYATKRWDEVDSRIRGRKFYWHHKVENSKIVEDFNKSAEGSKTESQFKFINFNENNNKKFVGKIYFEDLTEKELKDLVFSIELGGDNHMLKIGHGKPFGYGSILCKCENIYLRKIINNIIVEDKYVDFVRNTWNNYPNSRELELITKFDIIENKWKNIHYPIDFKWFAEKNNQKLILENIENIVKNVKENIVGKSKCFK